MESFFNTSLFNILGQGITAGQISGAVLICISIAFLYWLLSRKLLTRYFKQETIKVKPEKVVRVSFRYVCLLLALIGVLWSLNLDYSLYKTINIDIRITTILKALLIFQMARLVDWGVSKVLIYNYERTRQDEPESTGSLETSAKASIVSSKTVQYLVYIFAVVLILKSFQLDYHLFDIGGTEVRISSIFMTILVLLAANLLAWIITQLVLHTYYRKNEVNVGSRYAINQLLKYIIYVVGVFVAIEQLGVKMTVVWGGLAALMVGVGLGLQQTFNDLFSGIILLFERTVEVGDVVEVGSLTGTVKRIGLRTSVVESRDNRTIFVPNSKLIMDNVVNWTSSDDKVRFIIEVGVAYGSDTEKVRDLLIKAAKENIYVLDKPTPAVRFTNFGDSALDFELMIWSRNFIVIEDIKSDLRFEIDRLFRENDISIPFPQRDIWIRK